MTLPYSTAVIANEDAKPVAQRRWHQLVQCVCKGDTESCPALHPASAMNAGNARRTSRGASVECLRPGARDLGGLVRRALLTSERAQ